MVRDDLYVNDSYAVAANHSEEEGKKTRSTIWKVTILLSLITAVEVAMGIFIKQSDSMVWEMTKWAFIIMTLVKAAFIVMSFMPVSYTHLTLPTTPYV